MADDNQIPLQISAETQQAQQAIQQLATAIEKAVTSINKSLDGGLNESVKKVEDNTKKSANSITSFFTSVKGVAVAAIALFAAKEVVGFFTDIVSEAAEADKNVQALNIALASTGEFSKESSQGLQDFASEVQRTTTLTDDAVLQALTLAKSFGITNDEAKKLTQAAIQLSAATGKDLDTSINTLGGTLSGSVGKLGKLGGEFKNLTEEQLKSGVAIDLVAKRYKDFAEGLTKTFSGAVTQASNNFGEILESLGKSITQNPLVIASINAVSKAFENFAGFVGKNQGAISDLISTGIKFSLSFVAPVLDGIGILAGAFQGLTKVIFVVLDTYIELSDFLRTVLKPIIDLIAEFFLNAGKVIVLSLAKITSSIANVAGAIPGVSQAFEKFGINIDEVGAVADQLVDSTFDSLLDGNKGIIDSVGEAQDKFSKFAKEGLVAADQGIQSAIEGFESFKPSINAAVDGILAADKASQDAANSLKNQTKETKDLTEANNAVAGSFDKLKGDLEKLNQELDKQTKSKKKIIDAEADRAEILAKNAEIELQQQGKLDDATKAIIKAYRDAAKAKRDLATTALSISDFTVLEFIQGIGGALDSFRDGIIDVGNSVGDIFKGQFDFSKLVTNLQNFGDAIGESIAKSLDNVTLGDVASGIKSTLVGAFEIGKSILTGAFVNDIANIVNQIGSFPKQLLDAFKNFDQIVTDLVRELPKVISSLIDQLPALGKKIADAIGPLIQKIVDAVPGIVTAFVKAIQPIIQTIFRDVIPETIKAGPALIRTILKALPGLIRTILSALPNIIKEIFKAIPIIVRDIAKALPDIILAITENLPQIVEAFVEGFTTAMPEIMVALIDELLVNGGLERIIVAIIKAIPRIAVALVKGFAKGMLAAGKSIAKSFIAAVQAAGRNIGTKISDGFKAGITAIGGFFGNLANNFRIAIANGANEIPGKISLGFQNGIAQLGGAFSSFFANIGPAFASAAGQLFSAIQSAFSGIFAGLFNAIWQPFANFFANIGQSIKDAFSNPLGELRKAITEPFKPIIDFFKNFKIDLPSLGGGGGGGKKGPITGIPGSPLALGGIVPDGFPNDSFPARLQSREMVLPSDISTGLVDLIRSGGLNKAPADNGPDLNTALLNKIANLLSQPMDVNTTATVNGKAFADIILQLSRNNARLTA